MLTRKLPFREPLHQGIGEGVTPFPGLLHFTLDLYLIMLSVKQGDIKYHFSLFLSLSLSLSIYIYIYKTLAIDVYKYT